MNHLSKGEEPNRPLSICFCLKKYLYGKPTSNCEGPLYCKAARDAQRADKAQLISRKTVILTDNLGNWHCHWVNHS